MRLLVWAAAAVYVRAEVRRREPWTELNCKKCAAETAKDPWHSDMYFHRRQRWSNDDDLLNTSNVLYSWVNDHFIEAQDWPASVCLTTRMVLGAVERRMFCDADSCDHEWDPADHNGGGIWRPLHTAAQQGYTETVRRLLRMGADPHARLEDEEFLGQAMPLHVAAFWGRADIVWALVNSGADVDATNGNETALCLAVVNGYDKTTRALIQAGASVNKLCLGGLPPLNWVHRTGSPAVAEALIAAGARRRGMKAKNCSLGTKTLRISSTTPQR